MSRISGAISAASIAVASLCLGSSIVSGQTYTGRIGSAGNLVPSTTATTGETRNTHTGVSPSAASQTTSQNSTPAKLGTTVGKPLGR